MSTSTTAEAEIRKNLIEEDLVECIVTLPGQLFYSTPILVCLWFLTKNKTKYGKRDAGEKFSLSMPERLASWQTGNTKIETFEGSIETFMTGIVTFTPLTGLL